MFTAAERQAKIELYGRGFELLQAALQTCPPEMWQFKPAPHEWSIHEIIVHLADSETNAALRARMLAAEPGRALMAYDQDVWAQRLNYHGQDVQVALELTRLARLSTYLWLKTLSDEVFTHTAVHPEYDRPYSFEMWLNIYSGHIPGHIEQIQGNLALWKQTQE